MIYLSRVLFDSNDNSRFAPGSQAFTPVVLLLVENYLSRASPNLDARRHLASTNDSTDLVRNTRYHYTIKRRRRRRRQRNPSCACSKRLMRTPASRRAIYCTVPHRGSLSSATTACGSPTSSSAVSRTVLTPRSMFCRKNCKR